MRWPKFRLSVALATVVLCAPHAGDGSIGRAATFARAPDVVLWAWEQPQDLSFIDPARVGIAFLARTVTIAVDGVRMRPRMQPLRVPPATAAIAVARIETRDDPAPSRLEALRPDVVAAIADLARLPGIAAVQVDYDAPRSQRTFYRALLADLRRALPDSLALSMTALASWCVGDRWLDGIDVDEAVPMVFRMGADARVVRHALARGDFPCAECRTSIGIATDEAAPPRLHGRRVYVFHPGPWTPEAARAALARITQ
jgi:hypothetical protein